MISWSKYILLLFATTARRVKAQYHKAVRITESSTIKPAEVSMAISRTNPGAITAVSLAKPAQGEPRVTNYIYVTMDGGKTWKPSNPKSRTSHAKR